MATNDLKNNRKKYHHGALRTALVAAGLEILEEQGLDGLSLRAIAARVGVSHTAPKNHFDGLKGLLTAIATEGFRRHAEAMTAGLTDAATPEDRLRASVRGYQRFAEENPALFQLMFSPILCDHADPDLQAAASASYGVLRRVATGLDWPGADGPDRQRRTELMLWSFVHGHAMLTVTGQLPTTPDGRAACDIAAVLPAFRYDPEATSG